MSVTIKKIQADTYIAALEIELNDEFGDTVIIEGVRVDNGDELSITFDTQPSPTQLIQLTEVLKAHDGLAAVVAQEVVDNNHINVPDISPNKVWMGDRDSRPQEVDVYTKVDTDSMLGGKANTSHTHRVGDVTGLTERLGSVFQATFSAASRAANRWLDYAQNRASNQTPLIIPWNSKLIGITFSNREDDISTDVYIYRANQAGGIKGSDKPIHTWSIRDARVARQMVFPKVVNFGAGDKVAVFLRDAGTDPKSPTMVLYFQQTDNVSSDYVETFDNDLNED